MIERTSATEFAASVLNYGRCCSIIEHANIQLSPELEEAAQKVQEEVTAAQEAEERELELMRQEGEAEELAAE